MIICGLFLLGCIIISVSSIVTASMMVNDAKIAELVQSKYEAATTPLR